MNRPIKFMVGYEGKLYPLREIDFDTGQISFGYNSSSHCRKLTDVTLHQFTGLLDKDGKEIYEGHIVKFRHYSGAVSYEAPCFRVKGDGIDIALGLDAQPHRKIIGHIAEGNKDAK